MAPSKFDNYRYWPTPTPSPVVVEYIADLNPFYRELIDRIKNSIENGTSIYDILEEVADLVGADLSPNLYHKELTVYWPEEV